MTLCGDCWIRFSDPECRHLSDKDKLRLKIQADTDEYLRRGGKITTINQIVVGHVKCHRK